MCARRVVVCAARGEDVRRLDAASRPVALTQSVVYEA